MSSIDDKATELEEFHRAAALMARKPVLPLLGYCHNCEEACSGKFCSPECRQDFTARMRFKGKRDGY